jgi:nucleoside-diphosphate-sugar epimerase
MESKFLLTRQNILLTGSSGFVGINLISYFGLNSKWSIGSFKRDESFIQGNLTKIFNGIDVVIHLAGKAHDLKNVSNPDGYYQGNTELTKRLYDAFLKSSATKFVYISSVKAVADSLEAPLTENQSPVPQTHYGKSKLMAEQYIQNHELHDGQYYYILRPCMIHGPGNKGNLNLLYKLISKGIPYPLASFENKRSFLSIENLCFVIRELLERDDIPSGVYNVADDETLSTNELIKLIAGASNRKPKLWKISPVLIKSIAKLGDFLKLPLTTERLNKLTESYVVDNTKIKHALGKEFPVQAREGILKTIKSFQKAI